MVPVAVAAVLDDIGHLTRAGDTGVAATRWTLPATGDHTTGQAVAVAVLLVVAATITVAAAVEATVETPTK